MDSGQVGIFEQGDKVGFGGFLESHDGRGLEAKVGLQDEISMRERDGYMHAYLEVLGDFTNETLEGKLADQELGGLLVATNFTESDGT